MSEKHLRVGQRVEVKDKSVRGKIAYVGVTTFAVGKWVGVVLDEPKGKNNGSIKGISYFTCLDNYGMFVRPTQLIMLDDSNNPIEDSPEERQPRSRLSRNVAKTPSTLPSSIKTNKNTLSASSLRSLPGGVTKPTAVRRKSPIKTLSSKKPPQQCSMTSSASSSRLSLAGSRLSLLGSRSQLASPATERPPSVAAAGSGGEKKTNISPPDSLSTTSKRASFVETGFLETLRPQFTAGQSLSLTPSTLLTNEDKINALQQQQEIEDLQKQVQELTDKLETLKTRRAVDQERLKEFDRMKTQYDQLLEFKSKIIDAQTQLQRELQRSRQETKDAIEAKDRHMDEMSELSENVEMITLDKEMAEEKADTLQLELESAKERIEELSLDLQIMKTEMENRTGSGGGAPQIEGVATTYEYKQLEQQNVRLRETLVRLRDLSAHEKHEIQKICKELDLKKSEVAELQRTKEKLSAKIDQLEAQVLDLQEQVDAALGAEEMVEQLAEKKMELEDKVKLLEEEVAELEALEEVHEQLIESNHDLEMDLREELDMALSAKREMVREKEAALETIVDRDQTILKFRELVQKLNEQIIEMREKASAKEDYTKPPKDTIADTIDFKQMFEESKAYTRAIDLQLRQIELKQANEHVRLLTAFMPETFMSRGGDHDAILVILLISRIVFKSGIIINQARERFPAISTIDRTAITQGHSVQQFEFKSRLLHHVHNLQAIMHQFLYGLNTCKPENLLKTGASLPEMIAQEKIIDGVVELLKANQLDENSTTDLLEKCVSFFNAMHSVLLGPEDLMNETQMVRDCAASIATVCDSISTAAGIIQALIQGGDETSDSGLLMQYVVQNSENIRQQIKLVKRRLPQDPRILKCGLSMKTIQTLKQTSENLGKIMSVLHFAAKQVLQNTAVDTDADTSISHTKLMEILSNVCEQVYEQEDLGPAQNLRSVLSNSNTDMSQLAQYLLEHEYEVMSGTTSTVTEKQLAPIVHRAQFIKKQLEETKTLTATLENREAEIRQLKLGAKMKQNELSEMQIRKDLAEKKLSVLQHDHEINTEKLQRQYEETLALLKKKEKEYEETMDHLQNDIDSLENERGALRDKLKTIGSKKGADLKNSTAFDITAGSPYIAQELALLKKAFNDERTERLRLQASDFKKTLSKLEPIYVPQPKDNRITELEKDLAKVRYDWVMSMVTGAGFPKANTSRCHNVEKLLADYRNKQKVVREEIKLKANTLASEVLNEYLHRKPYRAAKGDFSQFPTVELTHALKGM